MSRVTVVKFVAGKEEARFSFAMAWLRLACKVLPPSAIARLEVRGIHVESILQAQKLGKPYSLKVEVLERGVPKTVVVSVTG